MSHRYDPSITERKWRKKWEEENVFRFDLTAAKDPFYSLVMFPYPSGARLHVGHWFQYSIPDSHARFLKMQGKDVFHPMGFDAFGLPAENYAIKTGVRPDISTEENVRNMIVQFSKMGVMYDWDHTLNTSEPDYYRWTQWLFLQMYSHGLAYKKKANVNWCPKDQTVLANEQAQDGKCERCGTEIIQKPLEQWFWKITDYSQRLLDGLDSLDWPEKTKTMQRNWIGRSEGAEVRFIVDRTRLAPDLNRGLTVGSRTVHLVFTPKNRFAAFEKVHAAETIVRILFDTAKKHDIVLHEVAAMPDHVHLLVSFDAKRHLENDIVKKLKGASARWFLSTMKTDDGHLWGEKKHFEDVLSQEQFDAALRYIQKNPAADGLDDDGRILSQLPLTITVYTTRIDTLFSAAFVVLAPEHPLVDRITTTDQREVVFQYIAQTAKKTVMQRTELEKDKTGVFTGAFVINPANGEKLQVWIADFVLAQYGTGSVFADAHDERDFIFAKKYNLPLKTTIRPADGQDDLKIRSLQECFSDDGILYDSAQFSGMTSADARQAITAWLGERGYAKNITTYRLRDWLVSRQRYWGAPIPIVYDPQGNAHPVPDEHLPWLLPTDSEFKPTGESPLKNSKEFIERTEKIFGKGWRPEFDTMDTFVCSSFYYLRFLMSGQQPVVSDQNKTSKLTTDHVSLITSVDQSFIDSAREKKWMPVDLYIGGPEHACMHLIYARFVMMALKDFGFVEHEEPFKKLIHQGLITNKGAKMSKSKGNVVSPDAFVERYGADVFRMFLMFMGPFTQGGDWSDTGIKGIDRFVQRMYRLFEDRLTKDIRQKTQAVSEVKEPPEITAALHVTIKKVTEDIDRMQFNTAIASLMELLNLLEKQDGLSQGSAQIIAKLLAPLAPHLAEELWQMAGGEDFVIRQGWPTYEESLLQKKLIKIIVQINGKMRGDFEISPDLPEKEIIALAKSQPNVVKFLNGLQPKKEIYVRGRLVSLVI